MSTTRTNHTTLMVWEIMYITGRPGEWKRASSASSHANGMRVMVSAGCYSGDLDGAAFGLRLVPVATVETVKEE